MSDPVVLHAEFTARPERLAEVERLIADLAGDVRREPGNVEFTVYQRTEEPCRFFVFERYADRSASRRTSPRRTAPSSTPPSATSSSRTARSCRSCAPLRRPRCADLVLPFHSKEDRCVISPPARPWRPTRSPSA